MLFWIEEASDGYGIWRYRESFVRDFRKAVAFLHAHDVVHLEREVLVVDPDRYDSFRIDLAVRPFLLHRVLPTVDPGIDTGRQAAIGSSGQRR